MNDERHVPFADDVLPPAESVERLDEEPSERLDEDAYRQYESPPPVPKTAARPSLSGRVGIVAILLLPALALVDFALALVQMERVPDLATWQKAAQIVRSSWKSDDVVVFSPAWAQQGAPYLVGLDVVTAEKVDWYEVGKHGRVWVLASLEGRDPSLPTGYRALRRETLDGIDVCLFVPPAHGRLIYDFLAHIQDAKVTRVTGSRREECKNFRDRRWYCGAVHPWQFVGRRVRDIAGAVREVIWAHPYDKGDRLEVRYPAVTMGRRLVLHFGLSQRAIESGKGAPLTFQVKVGPKVVMQRELMMAEAGWFEKSLDVKSLRGQPQDIAFTLWTRDFTLREFAFRADLWD